MTSSPESEIGYCIIIKYTTPINTTAGVDGEAVEVVAARYRNYEDAVDRVRNIAELISNSEPSSMVVIPHVLNDVDITCVRNGEIVEVSLRGDDSRTRQSGKWSPLKQAGSKGNSAYGVRGVNAPEGF